MWHLATTEEGQIKMGQSEQLISLLIQFARDCLILIASSTEEGIGEEEFLIGCLAIANISVHPQNM